MESFFNDLNNRDVIRVIGSFLDFISLGNFLKTSKVINMSCKGHHPEEGKVIDSEVLRASERIHFIGIQFYSVRVINSSCFYRPVEVIIYYKDVYRKFDDRYVIMDNPHRSIPYKITVADHEHYHFKMSEQYFVINGKKQGYYKRYFENGNIGTECFYKDDKIDGSYRSYWSDGRLHVESFYKDGKFDGTYKLYQGNYLREEAFFKDGEMNGLYIIFFEDGTIERKYLYKDNRECIQLK